MYYAHVHKKHCIYCSSGSNVWGKWCPQSCRNKITPSKDTVRSDKSRLDCLITLNKFWTTPWTLMPSEQLLNSKTNNICKRIICDVVKYCIEVLIVFFQQKVIALVSYDKPSQLHLWYFMFLWKEVNQNIALVRNWLAVAYIFVVHGRIFTTIITASITLCSSYNTNTIFLMSFNFLKTH